MTIQAIPAKPVSRWQMFFTALAMMIVPFMWLWAAFRAITGSAYWRRAWKYYFVMVGVVIVGIMLASVAQ